MRFASLVIQAAIFLAAAGLLSRTTAANGATIHVKSDAPGYNLGTSWEFAFTNLQDALEASQPDDELWVARGDIRLLSGSPDMDDADNSGVPGWWNIDLDGAERRG